MNYTTVALGIQYDLGNDKYYALQAAAFVGGEWVTEVQTGRKFRTDLDSLDYSEEELLRNPFIKEYYDAFCV